MSRKLLIACTVIGTLMYMGGSSAMGEDASRKAPVSPPEDWPVVTVPGRIVFQSNRDGALSEVWLLEQGKIRKLASGTKTSKDMSKELPILFHNAMGDLTKPKWSPDGSKILCIGEEELIFLSPTGETMGKIKPKKWAYDAIWAPDGKALYYKTEDRQPKGSGSENIYRIDLQNNSEKQITNLPPMPGVRRIGSFSVSPDDKLIVLQVWGEQEYGISIWTINTDGSNLKLLVKYAGDPAWSPDGSKLAYISRHSPTGQRVSEFDEIFVLNLKSGKTTQITHDQWADSCPVFSPDGKKLAFESARHLEIAHGAELFVINLDGTGEARLTPSQPNPKYPNDPIRGWATDEHPDWAPW